jgi:magnesium transporter
MIRVVIFEPDGALRCGGEELIEVTPGPGGSIWIDLEGADPKYERRLAGWGFHPLAIEDTFTLQHQPKAEEYADHLFLIVRGIDFNAQKDPGHDRIGTLKLAAFLSRGRLVTCHRAPLRSVTTTYKRIQENGRALPGGGPQILWTVCDEMMDLYFPVIDSMGAQIEQLEQEVVADPEHRHMESVLALRRKLSTLRRSMLPHRQVFNHLANSRGGLVDETASLNFRDTLDNVLRLTDAIDQQVDLLVNVKDTYLSVLSQRTNEIMRVLTVFSAIVLPLSLIAGIYGMNFENMPELGTRWGYFVVLGSMVAVAAGMILWFRRRRFI